MSRLVDRAMMESVFPPEKIVRLKADKLPSGLHESARRFLTEVGLPRLRNSWFMMDPGLIEEKSPNGPRLCREINHLSRYKNMPKEGADWIILGEVPYDGVILDPASGAVYCLPDNDVTVYMLNQSLDSFAYFLYLLETERPNYDFAVSEEIPDSEGVAAHLRESMIRIDPVSFEGVEPGWSEAFDWEANDAPHMPTWDRVLHNVYESLY
ncbi:SUKH-4 family immunity protein [Streptomyces sp. NPDC048581]|uniref:SUKH-4 family immunity protein n=1 Tax=unclassified Streptomyces TaxID=2593676 RepID=UPI00371A84C8